MENQIKQIDSPTPVSVTKAMTKETTNKNKLKRTWSN